MGAELMSKGPTLRLAKPRSSGIWEYRRLPTPAPLLRHNPQEQSLVGAGRNTEDTSLATR